MIPPEVVIEGVCDSKAILTEESREEVYEKIIGHPKVKIPSLCFIYAFFFEIKWAFAVLDREEIDILNILQAAMKGNVIFAVVIYNEQYFRNGRFR